MVKTRDISTYDYLQALQREYISAEIRSKIYIFKNDKEYFKGVMEKKEGAILFCSKKNRLENILESETEFLRVWQEMVPKFGFPTLVYNVVNVTKEELEYCYSGSAVTVVGQDLYGMVGRVSKDQVNIIFQGGNEGLFKLSAVKRLNHQQTDEYFYYSVGNHFHTEIGTGLLKWYDFKTKQATIEFKDKVVILLASKISRIL